MSYDAWKTTDPVDEALGRSNGQPVPYRCRDCAWRGKGSIARREHWEQTYHTVLHANDPRFKARDERRKTA